MYVNNVFVVPVQNYHWQQDENYACSQLKRIERHKRLDFIKDHQFELDGKAGKCEDAVIETSSGMVQILDISHHQVIQGILVVSSLIHRKQFVNVYSHFLFSGSM
jgi:hypothetical protein